MVLCGQVNGQVNYASLVDAVLAKPFLRYGRKTADYWHRRLSFLCKPVSRGILIKAARFRIDNNKQDFSFFDCVGYVFAVENSMKFITGDKEFKDKPQVEFIS